MSWLAFVLGACYDPRSVCVRCARRRAALPLQRICLSLRLTTLPLASEYLQHWHVIFSQLQVFSPCILLRLWAVCPDEEALAENNAMKGPRIFQHLTLPNHPELGVVSRAHTCWATARASLNAELLSRPATRSSGEERTRDTATRTA